MFNFPNAPTPGQVYAPGAGAPSYVYDGQKWTLSAIFTHAAPFDGSPSMDGTASAGSAATYARADHVHPADTSRAAINNSNFTGTLTAQSGQLNGNLTVYGSIKAGAKSHRIGMHGGVVANGAVTQADAEILLYDYGGGNWCGIGCDPNGYLWVRTGLSGTPAPAFYIDPNNQVVNFLNPPTMPTPGAGDNSGKLATTAFVKARSGGLTNFYPLDASKTIVGGVTVAGDIYAYALQQNSGNYGVLYLGNTGSRYLIWDGSNYSFSGAHVYSKNGRLYGTNDYGSAPYNNARLAYIADYNHAYTSGLAEPYSGCTITGNTGDMGGAGNGWLRRYRQFQYYTTSWFAIGYA